VKEAADIDQRRLCALDLARAFIAAQLANRFGIEIGAASAAECEASAVRRYLGLAV
jgi:hypothetical protein